MGRGRTLFVGTVLGAVASLVTAPRAAGTRRAALERLRAGLRRRGGVAAFAGTPCSREAAPAGPAGPSGAELAGGEESSRRAADAAG